MWIIQVTKNFWIDANKIEAIWVRGGKVQFSTFSNPSDIFTVDAELESTFLNHLGAKNENHCCQIQTQVEEAKK